MRTIWYVALVSTICLEGLGRKYLPDIPSAIFYFAKDVVLLVGLYLFRPSPDVLKLGQYLYRGFKVFWVVGVIWTVGELLNPQQESWVLGLMGLRAYWLWWLAPFVVAGVLQEEKQKRQALYVLLAIATGVSVLAVLQFAAPADSSLNLYSVVEGQEVYAAQVHSTGRARVSSTFSYITGFSAFTIMVPTLLLSIGLDARDRKARGAAFVGTCITAAVLPMSGSRGSVLIGTAILVVTAWVAGLFATRIGRRVLAGGIVAALMAVAVFPDAFLGVQDRFGNTEETRSRYALAALNLFPPAAITTFNYPTFGIGTGMMQAARATLGVRTVWEAELEAERYLIELGPIGFLLIWTTKMGLAVSLLRSYSILKRGGRRGASAAAISFAIVTMVGSPTFDHIWQALYFMSCGFVLAEVVSVVRASNAAKTLAPDRPGARAGSGGTPALSAWR